MFLKNIGLLIIGICSGALVAGGLFTFINKIGIVTRLAETTKTAGYVHWYEMGIIMGAICGNILSARLFPVRIGEGGNLIFGLFSGIFVGCLIGAIAEVLNTVPIFLRRINVKKGLTGIVLALAFGKFFGVILQYFL